MYDSTLNHAVETCGGASLFEILNGERGEVFIQIAGYICAKRRNINVASSDNSRCVFIVKQGEQKVL